MGTSPFDMEALELVNRFMNACAEAGISRSGLCIDVAAGIKLRKAHLLKAAVLARIEGATPPFKTGDKVKVAQNQCFSAKAEGWKGARVEPRMILTVNGIFYEGNGKWLLDFKEIPHETGSLSDAQYNAGYFEKASEE
jgi:hypothetical protein